jgi:YhcN/YlaJ family sporulation lipoprotein
MTAAQAKEAAKRISDEVTKLSEVENATTAVVGNTALIGVNFASQYKGQMTTRIKDMVSERAKKAAPSIKNVAVTADPDLLTRIKSISSKLETGGGANGISTEFSEIVNRIKPL